VIRKFIVLLVVLCFNYSVSAQTENDSITTSLEDVNVIKGDFKKRKKIDPLRPAKAAFYSALLPGLGQAYNKKYWKIPIVYAAIGTGVYFYVTNNNQYNRYRDAYKRRLAGYTDDEFYGTNTDGTPLSTPRISNDGLIRAQRTLRRNKELSLLITFGLYALNIIEANVNAHLLQFNVDENLSLRPHFKYNQMENTSDLGVTLKLSF